MSFLPRADGPLDYYPCRHGNSKLLFRGPRRKLDRRYVAVLGGTETYGRFIEKPYPALVEETTEKQVINLGYVNAGVDVFLQDQSVMEVCAKADATVIQLLGAQNLTNRFYAVHPRRNDRLVSVAPLLQTLFRDVDFSEFNFTRHLLVALQQQSPERFVMVADEIKSAWLARMRQLLSAVGGKKILLWIGEEAPGDGSEINAHAPDPLFVTRGMIDELQPLVADVVEVVGNVAPEDPAKDGMVFAPEELSAATTTAGVQVHQQVAEKLQASLKNLLG